MAPFGTDDCGGGEELTGLRCQSRLFQPDDPFCSQHELDHEAADLSRFHDMVRFESSSWGDRI